MWQVIKIHRTNKTWFVCVYLFERLFVCKLVFGDKQSTHVECPLSAQKEIILDGLSPLLSVWGDSVWWRGWREGWEGGGGHPLHWPDHRYIRDSESETETVQCSEHDLCTVLHPLGVGCFFNRVKMEDEVTPDTLYDMLPRCCNLYIVKPSEKLYY